MTGEGLRPADTLKPPQHLKALKPLKPCGEEVGILRRLETGRARFRVEGVRNPKPRTSNPEPQVGFRFLFVLGFGLGTLKLLGLSHHVKKL